MIQNDYDNDSHIFLISMAVHQSVVKWFSSKTGYGFIQHPDGGADIFVHYSEIESKEYRTLKAGEVVSFKFKNTPKGLYATNVTRERKLEE